MLIFSSCVELSLLSKFHHQITYCELKCITECPAPYHIFLVISMFVIMRHVNYIYLKFWFYWKKKGEKYNYVSVKLNNPQTSVKRYWSTLQTFYNGYKVLSAPLVITNNKRLYQVLWKKQTIEITILHLVVLILYGVCINQNYTP